MNAIMSSHRLLAPACLSAALLLALAACSAPAPPLKADVDTPAAPVAAVDVVELSVANAQSGMSSGQFTSAQLVEAYLARIAAVDDSGPTLNAVISLNPNAASDAIALDAERAAGKLRGPLHGIPVLIKDNIDIAGMPTTAGSLAMAANVPKQDAFLVQRLRAAGAVILGKTNLSEWANFRSTHSTSGWSSAGGQTRNPYVLDRNPCGSSSGTGAAIAASFATVGVGTETDGSILCPSAVNGLVGLKPTVGVISRSGIVPISRSQDTAGPMARTVADAAALMTALAGVDPSDPEAASFEGRTVADYAVGLDAASLQGKRIGVLRQAMGYHTELDARTEEALQAISKAGAVLIDVELPTWGQWRQDELTVLLYEFKDGLNDYLAKGSAPVGSLEALIAWNKKNADRAMPYFAQELFDQAQAKGPLTDDAYLKARAAARRLAGEDGLLKLLREQRLHALIAPTTGPSWPTDLVLGDHFTGAGYGAAAVAGTPSITIPAGEVRGLPVGVCLMGAANSEQELLALGAAVERAVTGRRTPHYTATLHP